MAEPKQILITGASGFIGSFLCEAAVQHHMTVWAGMRLGSSRRWLQNEWLQFVTLDLTDRRRLAEQLAAFKARHGRWDYVIHAAGATKCLREEDFDRNNYDCTVNLVETLRELDMVPELFVYMSSLSVMGDACQPAPGTLPEDYREMTAADVPVPNTAYGRSKAKSEAFLRSLDGSFPYVVFRPTGVYGPRERDYYLMAKSISRHVDFAVGFRPQRITFVYVRDLVGAVLAAIDRVEAGAADVVAGQVFHVSDGHVYDSRDFSDAIRRELAVRHVWRVTAPLWLLRVVCALSEEWARLRGRTATLNHDKYRILRQRNWKCDITPLTLRLGYRPEWPLIRGVKETVAWYRQQHWL